MRRLRVSFPAPYLLLGLIALSSCNASYISGSFDYKTIDEKGQSALNYDYDPGWNAAMGWLMGLSGAYGGKADRQYDLPYDYSPQTPTGGFAIGPRVEIVRKGGSTGGAKIGLTYINVVGDVLYTWKTKDDGLVFAGLGPYVGYGMSGRASFGGMHTPAFGSDAYKRFDAGVDVSAGYRLPSGWFVSLGYEYGLADKSNTPSDYQSYNRSFSVNVGYSLDKIISAFKGK
jgi:hypothetical protein